MHTAIVGTQWGDEGKGKVVDLLCERFDVVARFQGGPNAGHTVTIGRDRYALHHVPSGVFRPEVKIVIGNGTSIKRRKTVNCIELLWQSITEGDRLASLCVVSGLRDWWSQNIPVASFAHRP